MIKRTLLLLLVLSGITMMATAQTPVAPTGAGTSASPYLISTWQHLYWMTASDAQVAFPSLNTRQWAFYRQTANIDLTLATPDITTWDGGAGWKTHWPQFQGDYNGAGFTIHGLFINRPAEDNIGLFGNAWMTSSRGIRNLKLTGVNVTGKSNVGALVGNSNGGIYENIQVQGTVTSKGVDASLQEYVGGVIGQGSATITQVSADVTVSAEGNPSVADRTHTGGIIGRLSIGSITRSFSKGSVSGLNRAGGLVGIMSNGTSITDSYSRASVSVTSGIATSVGGLVAVAGGAVTRSYATGAITGSTNNGLMQSSTNTTASFWDTQTSGRAASAGGTGKTTAEMTTRATFTDAGWDFASVWFRDPAVNNSYPILRWQPEYVAPVVAVSAPSGSGTVGDPYRISNVSELTWIGATDTEVASPNRAARWAAHYVQTANINLSGLSFPINEWDEGKGWRPIGNLTTHFTGSYNGNNYRIQNLFANRGAENSIGLFGRVGRSGRVSNLILEQVNITGAQSTGGLAGDLAGDFGTDDLMAQVTNVFVSGTVSGTRTVGGLAGSGFRALINRAGTQVTVTSSLTDQFTNNATGGLLGNANYTTVTQSYATGSVTGAHYAGGLIGYIVGVVTIEDSYARGNTTGSGVVVGTGALIGFSQNNSTLIPVIRRSYATGLVTGLKSNTLGGGALIGSASGNPVITATFGNTETTGATTNNNTGTGATTAQMTSATLFTDGGWDFSGVWAINAALNGGYPVLRWQSEWVNDHATQQLTGLAGWRLLASPSAGTFAGVLSGIWTQGGTGANTTAGTSNVFTTKSTTGSAIVADYVTDFNAQTTPGQGFAVYVYNADADGSRAGFPKTLSSTGTINRNPVSFDMSYSGQDGSTRFAIAGNPFPWPIQFDGLVRTQSDNVVWVYNPASDTYVSRSNGAGDFDGVITPFQGFWVRHASSDATPASVHFPVDVATGGTFRGKIRADDEYASAQNHALVVDLTAGSFSNSGWVVFHPDAAIGRDAMDAEQMAPLSGQGAMVYTRSADTPMDLNFLPSDLEDVLELPLMVGSSVTGEHTLRVRSVQLPAGMTIALVDKESGSEFELDAGREVTFEVPSADGKSTRALTFDSESRFVLRITPGGATSVDGPASSLPAQISLAQNWPNPFNPSTQIAYALPASGQVRLEVYDLLGRRVAVLVDAVMAAGSHTVSFNAGSLSSGVYIYRLETGGQTLMQRMTLLK